MSRRARIGIAAAIALGSGVAAWWLTRPAPPVVVIDRVELGAGVPAALGAELELGWRVRVGPVADGDVRVARVTGVADGEPGALRLTVRVDNRAERVAVAPDAAELAVAAAEALVRDLGPSGSLDYPPERRAAAGCTDPLAWRYWRRARRAREADDLERARGWARDALGVDAGCVMAHLELAASHQRGEQDGVVAMARAAVGAAQVAPAHQAEIRAWNAYYRGLADRP